MSSGHLDLEGLFLVNGNAERVDWLRQRYDSGEEVELEKEADLASAVSLLRLFLQELPEPVIPTEIQGHILQLHQGVWQGLLIHFSSLTHPTIFLFFLFSFYPFSLSLFGGYFVHLSLSTLLYFFLFLLKPSVELDGFGGQMYCKCLSLCNIKAQKERRP